MLPWLKFFLHVRSAFKTCCLPESLLSLLRFPTSKLVFWEGGERGLGLVFLMSNILHLIALHAALCLNMDSFSLKQASPQSNYPTKTQRTWVFFLYSHMTFADSDSLSLKLLPPISCQIKRQRTWVIFHF